MANYYNKMNATEKRIVYIFLSTVYPRSHDQTSNYENKNTQPSIFQSRQQQMFQSRFMNRANNMPIFFFPAQPFRVISSANIVGYLPVFIVIPTRLQWHGKAQIPAACWNNGIHSSKGKVTHTHKQRPTPTTRHIRLVGRPGQIQTV